MSEECSYRLGVSGVCDGHLYMAQFDPTAVLAGTVYCRCMSLTVSHWTGNHKPMSVHGAPGGGLYVTDQVPQLSLLAPDGAILGRCRPVLNGAHGMWRGPDGRIFLSEQNPPRLTCLVPV